MTDRVAASIVTLPLYPGMTEEQREYVRAAVVAAARTSQGRMSKATLKG